MASKVVDIMHIAIGHMFGVDWWMYSSMYEYIDRQSYHSLFRHSTMMGGEGVRSSRGIERGRKCSHVLSLVLSSQRLF